MMLESQDWNTGAAYSFLYTLLNCVLVVTPSSMWPVQGAGSPTSPSEEGRMRQHA